MLCPPETRDEAAGDVDDGPPPNLGVVQGPAAAAATTRWEESAKPARTAATSTASTPPRGGARRRAAWRSGTTPRCGTPPTEVLVLVSALVLLLSSSWTGLWYASGTARREAQELLCRRQRLALLDAAAAETWERRRVGLAAGLQQQVGSAQALLVERFLAVPVEVLELTSKSLRPDGHGRGGLVDHTMQHLWATLQAFRELDSVVYAEATGAYVQYWRRRPWWLAEEEEVVPPAASLPPSEERAFLSFRGDDGLAAQALCGRRCPPVNATVPGALQHWIINATTGVPLREVALQTGRREAYDPRRAPWYLQASTAGGRSSWSTTAVGAHTMRAARGSVDASGATTSVAAAEVSLLDLGEVLRSSTPAHSECPTVVIDERAVLVASSAGAQDGRPWTLNETGACSVACAIAHLVTSTGGRLLDIPREGLPARRDECGSSYSVRVLGAAATTPPAPPSHPRWFLVHVEPPRAVDVGAVSEARTQEQKDSDAEDNLAQLAVLLCCCVGVLGAGALALVADMAARAIDESARRMQEVADLEAGVQHDELRQYCDDLRVAHALCRECDFRAASEALRTCERPPEAEWSPVVVMAQEA